MIGEAQNALANLRDIHLPVAVPLWPPAPGWWLVAGVMLTAATLVWVWRRRKRESLRQAANQELLSLEVVYLGSRDHADLAVGLSGLLRRVALANFERGEVAALHGEEWMAFLASAGLDTGIPKHVAEALERAIYAGHAAIWENADGEDWIAAVRHWIRKNT
jgi:hypothetical protein